jgi:tetratricopeptide (TPR) repeat protein
MDMVDGGNPFFMTGSWVILGLLIAIPILAIIRACLVDGTLEFGFAFAGIMGILCLLGLAWQSQGSGLMLLWVALLLVVCLGVPLLGTVQSKRHMRQIDNEDIAKYRAAIDRDPNNASAYVFLGDALLKRGSYTAAIAQYERAMSISERFPQLQRKIDRLKKLEAGEVPSTRVIVCPQCQLENDGAVKNCTRCGEVLNMSFVQFVAKKENSTDIVRSAAPVIAALFVLVVVFSALPLEWKGLVLISSTLVGIYYFLVHTAK